MTKTPALLWTDLETPGLDHREPWSAIFEAGFVLTDARGEILAQYCVVPEYPSNFLDYAFERMDDVCKRMHAESGLMDELRRLQTPALNDPDEGTAKQLPAETWMESIKVMPGFHAMWKVRDALSAMGIDPNNHKLLMAGATTHFDRRWLEAFWPSLEDGFHYRNFDVSTIRKAVELLRPDLLHMEPKRLGTHRTLDDIRDAISYYKWAQVHFIHTRGGFDAGAS